ncbi:helix-turn-helix transcriptional regulator [Nonomuraea typhae]|uniref:helix-turn-helix transcriptional regulator n=1 Tax=Nonomuraea typhae TaxID=2603600 RepID=UPI0012FCB41E|nr:AraC family transcriptional regulator [Nonomuraea typhae]
MTYRGWVSIAPGRLYYGGRITPGDLHTHYAAQLLIGPGLVLRDAAGDSRPLPAALIPANTPHAIVSGTSTGLLALIDPAQTGVPGWLRDPRGGPPRDGRPPEGHSAASWAVDLDPPTRFDLPALIALVDDLTGTPPGGRHPALVAALEVVARTLPAPVRLAAVAHAVHLSESRLAHLFTGELGLPFRPYVLWERLRVALTSTAQGASLTTAAHEAGFADAAHLTRTVRRMMGDTPSALATGVRWLPFPSRG